MPTSPKLPGKTLKGKKLLAVELTEDFYNKFLEITAMCKITPGEYIEDAIHTTLADAYEDGPSFVLSCYTWDRREVKTVFRNVKRFMLQHLPDLAADPQKRFSPVPSEDEPGRWEIKMEPIQKEAITPKDKDTVRTKEPTPVNRTLLSLSREELIELFLSERESAKLRFETIKNLTAAIIAQQETIAKLRRHAIDNGKEHFIRLVEGQIGRAKASSERLNKEIAACERHNTDRASDLRFQNTLLSVEMEVLGRQIEAITKSEPEAAGREN